MEFGLFNSLYVPNDRPGHHRSLAAPRRDRAGQGRRPRGLQVHLGHRAPLPRRVLAPVRQRGVPRLPRRRHRAHPRRLRHLQHHPAGQPPGAGRGEGGDARPPVRRPVRVRRRPRLLDHRDQGASASRTPTSPARWSTRRCRRSCGCGRRPTTPSRAASSPCRTRNVLPKPLTDPHPPLWVAAGSPGTFKKAAEMGIGVLCFAQASMDDLAKLIAVYKEEIERCENPVGGYINNNVMVTSQLVCLEDGAAGPRGRRDDGLGLPPERCCGSTWTPSRARSGSTTSAGGSRRWTARRSTRSSRPSRCASARRRRWPARSRRCRRSGPTSWCSGCCRRRCRSTWRSSRWRPSGGTVLPRFDTDPVHSTTRQREAQLGG